MFSRCFATLLMFLAASPFNAPFCSVRLNEMFDVPSTVVVVVDSHAVDHGTAAAVLTRTVSDQATAHVRPVSRAKIVISRDQVAMRNAVFAPPLAESRRVSTHAISLDTGTSAALLALRV